MPNNEKCCPSPENPCVCECHQSDSECYECKIGRHHPAMEKELVKTHIDHTLASNGKSPIFPTPAPEREEWEDELDKLFPPDGDTINQILECRGIYDGGKCFKEDELQRYMNPFKSFLRHTIEGEKRRAFWTGYDAGNEKQIAQKHLSPKEAEEIYRLLP